MKISTFSLKTGACLAALLFVAQMTIPSFVPKAHALYWEDNSEFNAPQDRVERPRGGFFLFNWIGSITHSAKKHRAAELENRDKGPGVNSGKKALLLVTSAVVGIGVGLLITSTTTDNPDHQARNNFLGATFGLCGGLAVGSFIMPSDYQVDSANLPNARFRDQFAKDPAMQPIRSAFRRPMFCLASRF